MRRTAPLNRLPRRRVPRTARAGFLLLLASLAVPVTLASASATAPLDCAGGAVQPWPGAVTASRAAAEGSAPRQPALQPFTSDSPVNVPLGSGARFESASGTRTAAFLDGTPMINCQRWSIAVVRATEADPLVTLKNLRTGATHAVRIPSSAQTTEGTDKHLSVIAPDGHSLVEMHKATRVSSTQWTATTIVFNDLRGDGLSGGARASGISQLTGLIRAHEVAAGDIPHALAIGIPDSMLEQGPVWPAQREDSNAASAYDGSIPMGTMLAIPPSVDVTALGLSDEGLALARALQDYGGYVLIRSGTVAFFAEPAADAEAVLRMRRDWQRTLYPLMRVVTNSSESDVAGGGERRRPPAPPLAAEFVAPAPAPAPAPGDGAAFHDVPAGHPFHEEISWAVDQGILAGNDDGSFGTRTPMTRAAIAEALHAFADVEGYEPPSSARFSDVPLDHESYAAISWLVDQGLADPLDDGTFGAQAMVTRGATAELFYRYAQVTDYRAPGSAQFSDVPVGHPAFAEISWFGSTGITTGFADGTFVPDLPVNRASFAAFLFRLDRNQA